MRLGSPFAAGFGNPENAVARFSADPSPDGASVRLNFTPRSGYGDAWFGIYRDGALAKNVFAGEATETSVRVECPWGSAQVSVLALRLGHLGDPGYEINRVARSFDKSSCRRATLAFDFAPSVLEALDDGGFTSAWALNGLALGCNCAHVNAHTQWGELDLELAVSGGQVTVALALRGVPQAQGTATIAGAPFSVSLSERNASGLSGTLTVSNSVSSVSGARLRVRWPREMKILRGASDPPTQEIARVPFRGRNSVRWTEPAELSAGTYYYRLQPVSDTGAAGAASATLPVTIPDTPEAPTNLAYQSGNAGATVLGFTPSATSGATYRAYLAMPGAVLNLNDAAATAGVGASSLTLPAITGYPGTAYVVLRAVNAGVEEKSLRVLALEYDAAGNFVAPRPNSPGLDAAGVTLSAGRTLTALGTYYTEGEAGIAATLQLFVRTPSGSYDYSAPAASAALSTAARGIKTAGLTCTLPGDGWYYLRPLAATAGGTQSPSADAPEILLYASATVLPAPANPTIALANS